MMRVFCPDETYINIYIMCDNARHWNVFRCRQIFQPFSENSVVSSHIQPRETNIPSSPWQIKKSTHSVYFYLVRHYLTAPWWHLSSYVLKYLHCPLNKKNSVPVLFFVFNTWDIVGKTLISMRMVKKLSSGLKGPTIQFNFYAVITQKNALMGWIVVLMIIFYRFTVVTRYFVMVFNNCYASNLVMLHCHKNTWRHFVNYVQRGLSFLWPSTQPFTANHKWVACHLFTGYCQLICIIFYVSLSQQIWPTEIWNKGTRLLEERLYYNQTWP